MARLISMKPVPLALLASVALSLAAGADGLILPDHPERGWLTIVDHHVRVEIVDGVATTRVDQRFRNDSHVPLEGRYIFPLPPGAVVNGFAMWVDGQPTEAAVLPAEEARAVYEDYVRRMIDPALLEYVGRDTLSARVFPIPPGGVRRIEISYSEILTPEQGLYRYRYPLDTERFSARPLEEVTVEIDLSTSIPLQAVYSPTHAMTVDRLGPNRAVAVHRASDLLPVSDVLVYYSVSPDEMGLSLFTYRTPGEEGYFLLLVNPRFDADATSVPKDLLLVLDRSGSMSGDKIEQAKEALSFILRSLNPEDRFAVLAFNDVVESAQGGLTPVSPEAVAAAVAWVRRLEASGQTNIDEALEVALSMTTSSERPTAVVFLTDGEPTVGERDPIRITEHAVAWNHAAARLFCFGVGYNVNTVLLDRLTLENRGTSAYVQPGEDLEGVLASFYAKIAHPVLSDPTLSIQGVDTFRVHPGVLPDVFRGSQLLLVGRYRGSGDAAITLTGQVLGSEARFAYERAFPEVSLLHAFVPRLWAGRRIAYLIDQIRLYGESDELVDEVIYLSTRYGIITPYTSFLVEEGADDFSAEELAQRLGAAAAPATGSFAVQSSDALRSLAEAEIVATPGVAVKVVDDRVYFLRDDVWTDSAYADEDTIRIAYLSDAYFALTRELPWIAPHLAIGDALIVRVGQQFVEVGEEGVEVPTPELIDLLTAGSST